MCSSGQGGCCATSVAPPSQTNAGFGIALHACDQPSTSCPMSSQRATATALGRCLPSFSQPGRARRSVLLITNDQPDCDFGTDTPCNEARNAASTLYTQYNVSTYVVAPGTFDPTSNTTACLQGIAAYGGGKGNFRPASDMQELNDAIDGVVHSIAQFACHLDLTPSQIRSTDSVVLVWKGAVVPFDRSGYDGWDLTPNQNGYMIDLSTGKWCDRLIQDGPGAFTLLTDCNPAHH
jgi:hypothetical protein